VLQQLKWPVNFGKALLDLQQQQLGDRLPKDLPAMQVSAAGTSSAP
jgi:hypothetical protein